MRVLGALNEALGTLTDTPLGLDGALPDEEVLNEVMALADLEVRLLPDLGLVKPP